MAKEFNIVSTDDNSGYIVKAADPATGYALSVHVNFGSVVKCAREFFGEQKAKKENGDSVQAE